MAKQFTLLQLAEKLKLEINIKHSSAKDIVLSGCAPLDRAQANQLSFLSNMKYKPLLPKTKAGVVIISKEMIDLSPTNSLISPNPYLSFAKAVRLFAEETNLVLTEQEFGNTNIYNNIHPSAKIDSSVLIGPNVYIGSGVSIGYGSQIAANTVIYDNVCIGKNALIYPNTTIYHSVNIGDRVIIHAGAVIGSDGFGLAKDLDSGSGSWVKIPQLGTVNVSDDVEIGANTTIDRGAMGDTKIGLGVKIDNQVQIAHNVEIGAHTAIAAKTGIAGSAKIGSHCLIGGASGINGHIEITDQVMLAGMSMVTKSITIPGVYASGMPVKPQREWHKQVARVNRLKSLFQRVKKLED